MDVSIERALRGRCPSVEITCAPKARGLIAVSKTMAGYIALQSRDV
jgi:hypothetical protein